MMFGPVAVTVAVRAPARCSLCTPCPDETVTMELISVSEAFAGVIPLASSCARL